MSPARFPELSRFYRLAVAGVAGEIDALRLPGADFCAKAPVLMGLLMGFLIV
jgi:hypothetical protein